MSIALESGRRHDGARFGRGGPRHAPPPAVVGGQGGGSSSAGRGSDSRAAVVQCEEAEEGDGEVQSSYRGPFDTMDALQDALPHRRGVSKFYNSKSSSLANAVDAVFLSQPAKDLANPENPSPKRRKGLPPFGIHQNKSQSKKVSPVADVTNSPMNSKKSLYPAVTNSSPRKSRSGDEHECCKKLPCHCLQRRLNAMDVFSSTPAALQPQLITVQMRSVPMVGLQDVQQRDLSRGGSASAVRLGFRIQRRACAPASLRIGRLPRTKQGGRSSLYIYMYHLTCVLN